MVTQLINGTTATTTNSRKHMDADSQARMIFDRLEDDFGKMVSRKDMDYIFYKNTAGGSGMNDAMFFYSEAPAYYDNTSIANSSQNTVALVGYRVNTNLQLERLGKGLTWDGATSVTTTPGGAVYLTVTGTVGGIPDTNSTIATRWPAIGTPAGSNGSGAFNDGADTDYHLLSDQTYRMEIAFLLSNGTVSAKPILSGSGINYTSSASDPPSTTTGTAPTYPAGARWFNTSINQGYICTSAANITSATSWTLTWNRIGIQDVNAIIVAIAILDTTSREILTNTSSMVNVLTDPSDSDLASSPPILMAQTWSNIINSTTFAQSAGIPQSAASQIRIYQRYFYINNKQ